MYGDLFVIERDGDLLYWTAKVARNAAIKMYLWNLERSCWEERGEKRQPHNYETDPLTAIERKAWAKHKRKYDLRTVRCRLVPQESNND